MRWWLLGSVLLASCAATPGWTSVPLDGEPVTLTATVDRVLVGTSGDAGPGLVWVAADGSTTRAGVSAHSGYAREGRWLGVAERDGRLVALAGARGGAHANVRWTFWRGDPTGLAEVPQPFETFGGWGAGTLAGVAAEETGAVILGSWQSATAGLEPTVWRLAPNSAPTRISSTGTALGNGPLTLHQAHGIATTGTLTVIAGSTTHLGDPIASTPTIWVARDSGPWHAYVFDEPGSVEAIGCGASTCLAVGRSAGILRAWAVDRTGVRDAAAPRLPLTANPGPSAPAFLGDQAWVAVPTAEGTRLLHWAAGAWSDNPGPPGSPTAVSATAAAVWVVSSAGASSTLWRSAGSSPPG